MLLKIEEKQTKQPCRCKCSPKSNKKATTLVMRLKPHKPLPIRFKQTDDSRLVLMLEQVVSRESIWEVIKAKDVLEGYVKGDYSIQPHVLRVANQVDSPLQTRVIF